MIDRGRLRPKCGKAGYGCRVAEFNMAGSDDAAQCQHVQGSSFLVEIGSA